MPQTALGLRLLRGPIAVSAFALGEDYKPCAKASTRGRDGGMK
jgi:hypothetical protein